MVVTHAICFGRLRLAPLGERVSGAWAPTTVAAGLQDGTVVAIRHVCVDPDAATRAVETLLSTCHALEEIPTLASRTAEALLSHPRNRDGSAGILALRVGQSRWDAWISGCGRLWNATTGALATPGLMLGELSPVVPAQFARLASTGVGGGHARGEGFGGRIESLVGVLAHPMLDPATGAWQPLPDEPAARLEAFRAFASSQLEAPGVVIVA